MKLFVIPLELHEANKLVENLHRHHFPVQGHRFSLGVIDEEGYLRGACIVGRPVARLGAEPNKVLEVSRLVTDGTKNICSMLYSASARIGKEMGFEKIQTFILADQETGISLKASGWFFEGISNGGQWKHSDGKPRRIDQPTQKKLKWFKILNNKKPNLKLKMNFENNTQDLFEIL